MSADHDERPNELEQENARLTLIVAGNELENPAQPTTGRRAENRARSAHFVVA